MCQYDSGQKLHNGAANTNEIQSRVLLRSLLISYHYPPIISMHLI